MKGKSIIVVSIVIAYTIGMLVAREMRNENYIDMRTVVGFDATETRLYLYTESGGGYYWEMEEKGNEN